MPTAEMPLSFGFFNGKGGVGKTTAAANVSGLLAAAGYRVLLADFDPQGNLCRDLGYEAQDGAELFSALLGGTAPPIIHNVGGRANLDVIPGGGALFDLAAVIISRQQRTPGARLGQMVLASLLQVAHNYDIIVFDTPPGDLVIIDAVMEVVAAVIIPVKADDASFDGMETVASRFSYARDGDEVRGIPPVNPNLQLAGVMLFGIGSRSTSLEKASRNAIEEIVGDAAPVFESRIRNLETTAYDGRRRGLLVHELELRTDEAQAARFAALRLGTTADDVILSRNASGLAEDWAGLTREILIRLTEITREGVSA